MMTLVLYCLFHPYTAICDSKTFKPFADGVDQDQTAQNVQSALESTLFDNYVFVAPPPRKKDLANSKIWVFPTGREFYVIT